MITFIKYLILKNNDKMVLYKVQLQVKVKFLSKRLMDAWVFSDLVMSCTGTFALYSQTFVCAVIIIMGFVTIERNRMHKKPI